MNKTELVAIIAENLEQKNVPVKKVVVEDVLNELTKVVAETLAKDEKVVVSGFGTFEVRNRVQRTGRNPRNGEAISIPEQKTPAFKAGKVLKDAVK